MFSHFSSAPLVVSLALSILGASSALASSSENFHFQPGKTVKFSLSGSVNRSIYETRTYETTCYRTEYTTESRNVCTPRSRESCSSSPVCRDVSRPICTSSGCTDYNTRECTTETSCTTVSDGEDCRTETYSVPHEIPYACTQSETVKVGEEFDHSEQGEFEFTFSGEGVESKADVFNVRVANGVDAGSGYHVSDSATSGKYLFFIKRTNDPAQDQTTGTQRTYKAAFKIHAVSIERLIRETKLKITRMTWNSKRVAFDLVATPAPEFSVDLSIKKDRLIGGNSTLTEGRVRPEHIQTTTNADGSIHFEIDLTPLQLAFNQRPHIAKITVGLDLSAIFVGDRLMNPKDEQALRSKIAARKSIKKKVR